MSNETNNELIIARGITKKDGKKPGQVITRLFFDAETTERVIAQLQTALQNQNDGVSLTVLEGQGKNGLFGMVAASGLEARDQAQAAPQTKAYTPAAAPAGQRYNQNNKPNGAYTPKTPGYKRS